MRSTRLLAALATAVLLLGGCGGGDDDAEDPGGAGVPSPGVSSDPKALNACRTAMISALSKAYAASQKAPADQRDQVFVEQAGSLPEECKVVDTSELKRLRDEATEIAIPAGN